MTNDQVQFYLRHRGQISEWAKLEKRADDLMRDAVKEGAPDKATRLLKGEYGDDEVDFYTRNRLLITEWDNLQTIAGQAVHDALLVAGREAGFDAHEGKRGWTSVSPRSPEIDKLRDEEKVWVEMAWTKQDMLSTRRGYPFPRLALVLHPDRWEGESRALLINATRPIAHEMGMKRKASWSVHWHMLDPISESQDPRSFADECVAKLQRATECLYPRIVETLAALPAR